MSNSYCNGPVPPSAYNGNGPLQVYVTYQGADGHPCILEMSGHDGPTLAALRQIESSLSALIGAEEDT